MNIAFGAGKRSNRVCFSIVEHFVHGSMILFKYIHKEKQLSVRAVLCIMSPADVAYIFLSVLFTVQKSIYNILYAFRCQFVIVIYFKSSN